MYVCEGGWGVHEAQMAMGPVRGGGDWLQSQGHAPNVMIGGTLTPAECPLQTGMAAPLRPALCFGRVSTDFTRVNVHAQCLQTMQSVYKLYTVHTNYARCPHVCTVSTD